MTERLIPIRKTPNTGHPSCLYSPLICGSFRCYSADDWNPVSFIRFHKTDDVFKDLGPATQLHIAKMMAACFENNMDRLPANHRDLSDLIGLNKTKQKHHQYEWLYIPEFIDIPAILRSCYFILIPAYREHCDECAANFINPHTAH